MGRWSLDPVRRPRHRAAVAVVASLAAAWGLYAVGDHLHDRRTGVLLAVVWGLLPHAIVESMAYTEAIFTALVAWSLLAMLRERWWPPGCSRCWPG